MRWAVFASVLLVAGPLWAQAPPPAPPPPAAPVEASQEPQGAQATHPEDPARMSQARERFQSGMAHYDGGRFREAIHDFELAASLLPSADIAYNIARCYEQLHDYDPAIQYYQRYLREKVEPPDGPEVEAKLTELRRLLELERQNRRRRAGFGLLRVTAEPPGVHVRIDRGAALTPPVAEPVRVGRTSSLTAEGEGLQPFLARVGARPGEIATAVVRPARSTRYETHRGGRLWTFILGGTALATAAVGLAFGIQAFSRSTDAGDASGDRQLRLYDEAGDFADRADFLFGGALLLGVATGVMYFVEGSSSETRTIR